MTTYTHNFYLVRHGENPANITKEFSYRDVDYSLTPKGVLQAQQTAAYFRNVPVDAVVASPLKRTRETAAIIADALGLPVEVMEDFREVNVGALERTPPTAANWALHHSVMEAWFDGDHDARFPDGEDYHIMLARIRRGLTTLTADTARRNVVVVGHGGIFTVPLKDICPNADGAKLRTLPNHNCSITHVTTTLADGDLRAHLVRWGAYDHLSGEAADLVHGVPVDGELEP
ncbi:MAG: histidine phosphatase family protein [Caldilineaceae bacterium]|nr:histidine phosphatase family protein [Caldilineaceae bacterium]